MPDIRGKKIFMGFWHNWGPSAGYQGGLTGEVQLEDIPVEYNVVAVAFMKGAGIPTFKPYNQTDVEFRRQVGVLNKQGRAVLISLGGADAHIELRRLPLKLSDWGKFMVLMGWTSIWSRLLSTLPITTR
jgi:chitinase